MNTASKKNALICGASVAGLTSAYWLNQLGYRVTLVEMADSPRVGGAALDLGEPAIDIVKRMGIYDELRARALKLERIEFKNEANETENAIVLGGGNDLPIGNELEIERTELVYVLMDQLAGQVDFMFNDTITALDESADHIEVTFKQGAPQQFDLVVGCDGLHSGVRKLWFGAEKDYKHFLGAYFSIAIVDGLLVAPNTMQFYNVPEKSYMINAYRNKTDIVLSFVSDAEISYDYRDVEQQKEIIQDQFAHLGWRTEEFLGALSQSDNFYFDELCQIKMPFWSKGRVVLVGDAAYAPSPGAGMGGSLAIEGATALADALARYGGAYPIAFAEYYNQFQPIVSEVQVQAEHNIKKNFIPRTDEAIRQRNQGGKLEPKRQ